MENQPFVGRGWSFPPTFSRQVSGVELVTGNEDIEQSLHIIFHTSLGERLMRPNFGCNLADEVFEPLNTSKLSYLEYLLKTAILYHEPRIDARDIRLRPNMLEGVLTIEVDYVVRETNSRFNFVYDFYIREAGA
jgi:phage baseplate assembly protein W